MGWGRGDEKGRTDFAFNLYEGALIPFACNCFTEGLRMLPLQLLLEPDIPLLPEFFPHNISRYIGTQGLGGEKEGRGIVHVWVVQRRGTMGGQRRKRCSVFSRGGSLLLLFMLTAEYLRSQKTALPSSLVSISSSSHV